MILRVILLSIGTLLAVLFAVLVMKGKKYESYVEALDETDYPLKELYVVGFTLASLKPFALSGKMRDRLISNANMMFGQHYGEYYANVIWAQALSFVHLFLCVSFWFASFVEGGEILFLIIGTGASLYCGYYWISKLKNDLAARQQACELELPEIVSSLALLINSGMTLYDAWSTVSNSKTGIVGTLMKNACDEMKNGTPTQDAIHHFGIVSNSNEIKKFTSSLAQGMQKGSEEIGIFLMSQSIEQWATKKQRMIQKGEVAASALLIPTTLIFAGVLIIIISTALGGSFL